MTQPPDRASPLSPVAGSRPREKGALLRAALSPLASLRFTVALFAMSLVIVLAGTLAQVHMEIWEVVHDYFRLPTHLEAYTGSPWGWLDALFARVPLKFFAPKSFFPDLPDYDWLEYAFYFPKGWLLGALMFVNLLSAHLVRFRVQARGARLAAGLLLLAVGVLVTYAVIHSGAIGGESGIQDEAYLEWDAIWWSIAAGLIAAWCVAAVAAARMDASRRQSRWLAIGGCVASGLTLVGLLAIGQGAVPDESSMRILWQLVKGTGAAAVLLAGCVLVFRQRAGVVLIHLGVGLLMFSELLVGTSAVESQFTAQDGQIKNYAEDRRTCELAVAQASGGRSRVVVIPRSLLIEGETIRRDDLPFDVTVVRFLPNTTQQFRKLGPLEENPATAGFGLGAAPIAHQRSRGTDADAKFDMPAAYVRLTHKGSDESIGTYLLSTHRMNHWDDSGNQPELVALGSATFEIALRAKRIYKPFWIEVVDAQRENYSGTQMARSFSTDVRLVDAQRRVILEKRIWMNNPLRFGGETYYQAGFHDDLGFDLTTLQVVSNRGWMIPYVSCMIVAVGMLWQFGATLVRFVRRQDRTSVEVAGAGRSRWGRLAPWAVALLAALGTLLAAYRAVSSNSATGLESFGELPVMEQGRCKPLDTLARSTLRVLAKQETFRDEDSVRHPAIRWLADVIAGSPAAAEHRVFKIENFELQEALRLEPRSGYLYSYNEIKDRIDEVTIVADTIERMERVDPARLTLGQRKLVDFVRRYRKFLDIQEAFTTGDLPAVPAADAAGRMQNEVAQADVFARLARQQLLVERGQPPLATPSWSEDGESTWETLAAARLRDYAKTTMPSHAGSFHAASPALPMWMKILAAYRAGDTAEFAAAVQQYREYLAEQPPAEFDASRTAFEAFFNRFEPFYLASWCYLLVFVLSAVSWLGRSGTLARSAFLLAACTLLLHTFALVARVYISGRPPVTTLYSSAVFISWGCVLLALGLERVHRLGIGTALGGACGAGALLVAHFLSYDSGDTFPVLVAVLDTQFWLATHVVCITLGYSTTFLAGALGAAYVLAGVCTPALDANRGRALSRMTYGTLCFGLFFSFVGTVLGGLWADDSWGRFWGWDPKENGALMIVLWNALVLHARWGGVIRDRGTAVLAIAGNIITAWSWFGTNELHVGLHSYGFTEGVVQTLFVFWGTQLGLVALGAFPKRWWWSERLARAAGLSG